MISCPKDRHDVGSEEIASLMKHVTAQLIPVLSHCNTNTEIIISIVRRKY